MILVFDYKCPTCGYFEEDKFVRSTDKDDQHCPACTKDLMVRQACAANVDWDSLAMGNNASPEAIRHWERKQRQEKARQKKIHKEHGDYGKAPGS